MIPLHRMTSPERAFYLNPDLVHSVEATPDTVVTLEGGSHLVVLESPEEVVAQIQAWRVGILARAATTSALI